MHLKWRGALALSLLLAAGVAFASPGKSPATAPTAGTTKAMSRPASSSAPAAAHPTVIPTVTERPVNSLAAAVIWYLALQLVGIAALALAYILFPYLADRGAGFAKVFGLALATSLSSLLVRGRFCHQGSRVAWISLAAVALASLAGVALRGRQMREFWRSRRRDLLLGEVAFTLGFVFFLGLRCFNPEILWGEKPMDFSILNTLVRTQNLPPSDPWFSGAPLGYYVFGQEMVAFLTLLTGLSTRFTFNLAFGLLGGTIAQGAFSLARDWAGRLRAGVIGATFTVLLGNLAGLREWLWNQHLAAKAEHLPSSQARHLDWHYFWATSRVVPDTINEYPLWSLLFADLHAHLLALPLFLLVVASSLQLLRAHADPSAKAAKRMRCAIVLGFGIAVQVLTNAWEVPLFAGFLVLILLLAFLSDPRSRLSAFLHATVSFVVTLATAFALLRPLWVRGGGAPGFGRNAEPGARGSDVLTHFGLFFFLGVAWWAVSASIRLGRRGVGARPRGLVYLGMALLLAAAFWSADALCVAGILLFLFALFRWAEQPEDRLAFGCIATAFFLTLFTQRMFIYDRMNTFFKMYFEAWPLLALATAVLVFRGPNHLGTFGNWPKILRGVFFVLLAAAAFTTVTAIRGGIFAPNNPSRPDGRRESPSLDGLRYLEKWKPAEYKAVVWLRRTIPGTPVILESQGNSYGDFSRISMLTGLPTVLGWEHHVKQRGNPESEVDRRRQAVREMYTSTDVTKVEGLLRRYHVGYVYVGSLERETYGGGGLFKFENTPNLFQTVYSNREALIVRVVGGDAQDVITPVRESVPSPQPQSAFDEAEEPPAIRASAEPGSPYAGMKEPRGAAIDGRGRLWVADFGNSRLRVFDAAGGLLGGWGGRGNGTFGFRELCGVAIRDDVVYVADTWNGRIQSFSLDGVWRSTAGSLFGPRGVATLPDGTVWVTDTGNKRLMVYDAGLGPGRIVGGPGSGPAEFSDPVGIAGGRSGAVYVADAGNQRIQMLDTNGHFIRQIAIDGWKRGDEPYLVVDDDGTLYATIPARNTVLQLDPSGSPKKSFATDDANQQLSRPTGVVLDRKSRLLYVINSGNNTVSKLKISVKKSS